MAWETRAMYRQILACKLEPQAMDVQKTKLKTFKVKTQLKVVESALVEKNFYLARKYLDKSKTEVRGVADNVWELCNTRCHLLRAKLELDPTPQVKRTLDAWDGIQRLRGRNATKPFETSLLLSLHAHTADFYSKLLSVVQEEPSVVQKLPDTLKEQFFLHLEDKHGDVADELKKKVVSSLHQAVEVSSSSSLADSYLKLARFCHQIEDLVYEAQLIESLLRAMRFGSAEARMLFPCLLQLPLLTHADLFISESRQVPEWMFLSWVNQLLASLDTEIGSVLAPLLLQLAAAFPVALQFPFQLSCEMYKYSFPAIKDIVSKLETLLRLDNTTATLLRALTCVCHPILCLQYHVDRLRLSLNQDTSAFAKAYALMRSEAYPPEDEDKLKGRAFNDVKPFTDQLEKHKQKLLEKKLSREEFSKKLVELFLQLQQKWKSKETQEKTAKRRELSSFSPWLMDGYEGEVEVPGQYTGRSRPLPRHHLTIVAFNRTVKLTHSLRAPIQVTIMGNDAKDHPYLIKFGEDLRQDQRIQQLFVLMNQLMRDDATTSRRQLSVDTYTVAPLNSRFGIIQWVENTTDLSNFMLSSKDLKKKSDEALHTHGCWFDKCLQDRSKFFRTTRKEESLTVYNQVRNKLPRFMLRDAVWRLAASPEAFMHLRGEMLSSHACLSVCHWVLGIGDRHLNNTLVCRRSGRFLGIDFGHAFGTATQFLPTPELMPLRLTTQILNLAAPLQETGLLKETMVHTLRVLRDNHRVLVATMAVFIQEPSIDWLRQVQKHAVNCGENAGDWYPAEKIAAARRKLQGVHPRVITEEELSTNHAGKPHHAKLLELLRDNSAADVPVQDLTSRQQVDCLIAQATSEHMLSKTFSGWTPWI